MEKKKLNLLYLLEETIKTAYDEKDCLFLTRLILRIIEDNQEIKFDINLNTLDSVICDRMAKSLYGIDNEKSIDELFNDVSEGVLKFMRFIIQAKKEGRL